MKQIVALIAALVLSGCETLQDAQPRDIPEAISYGYITIETTANAVRAAHVDGVITAEQREEFKTDLQQAKDLVDEASAAWQLGRPSDAEDTLQRANEILDFVIAILEARQ